MLTDNASATLPPKQLATSLHQSTINKQHKTHAQPRLLDLAIVTHPFPAFHHRPLRQLPKGLQPICYRSSMDRATTILR